VAVLKDGHRKVFKIMKRDEALGDPDEAVTAAVEPKEVILTPKPEESSDNVDGLAASFSYKVVSSNQGKGDDTGECGKEADNLLQKFLDEDQVSNKCLLEGARRIPSDKEEDITIAYIIASFNTMKYYLKEGHEDYPAIFVLNRIQFSRIDNSGFQERVFSTGSSVMSNNQAIMDFDCLEKRTLSAHGKDLIGKKIM